MSAVHRVAPITGMLRKKIVFDITMALGLGTACAYAWWYSVHIPSIHQRDAFYLKRDQEKSASRVSSTSEYVSQGN